MTSLRESSEVTTSHVEGKLNAVVMKIEEAEARLQLFFRLKAKNMCTKDVFQAAKSQLRSRRVLTQIDKKAMKRDMNLKIRDAKIHLLRLREDKKRIRQQLLRSVGGKRFKLREITKRLNSEAKIYRQSLDKSYSDKIKHYEKNQIGITQTQKKDTLLSADKLIGTSAERYSNILSDIDNMKPEKPALPMICSPDIILSDCELALLSKGPKFSVRSDLDSEQFEVELESMISKKKYRAADEADINETSTDLKEAVDKSVEKKIQWEENRTMAVYDWEENTVSLAKLKANKYKYNKHVNMPRVQDPQTEAKHDTRKQMTREVYRKIEKCLTVDVSDGEKMSIGPKRGPNVVEGPTTHASPNVVEGPTTHEKNAQVPIPEKVVKRTSSNSNLTHQERKGLKQLKRRISQGEIIVAPTDKSSKFAVLKPEQYIGSGLKHVEGDSEISIDEVARLQNIVNSHVSWINFIFNTGADWAQQDRMNINTHDEGAQTCGLQLLIKDHKGWSPSDGTVPPSRPVVSGNEGLNMHLSELVSKILEPIAEGSGRYEVNSTGHMLHKIDEMNKGANNEGEIETTAVEDISKILLKTQTDITSHFRVHSRSKACSSDEKGSFPGSRLSPSAIEGPTTPTGEQQDKHLGPKLGPNVVEGPTTHVQKTEPTSNENNVRGVLRRCDDLREDGIPEKSQAKSLINLTPNYQLQDTDEEMVIVGSDVCSLYPSLDIVLSAAIARKAVQESQIKIKDVNYQAALVYLLLQGGEDYLRRSGLARRIPVWSGKRRDLLKITGSAAFELKKWKFSHIPMTEKEERLITSMVVECAVVTIMSTHVYTFNGKHYLQTNGGPIGLNSTASLASVIMCWWDRMWIRLLNKLAIKCLLYYRYVDDCRSYLKPIRRGWRVTNEGLK